MRICDDCGKEMSDGENRKKCLKCGKACCPTCLTKHSTALASPRMRQRDRPHLTRGEKIVWAAIFAKYYNINDPPRGITADVKLWEKWENDQVVCAIECAATAVTKMRKVLPRIIEGFGPDDETTTFLEQILKQG